MSVALQRPRGPDGGLWGLVNLVRFQRDTLGFLTRAADGYGDVSYYRMGAFHFYQINHPDLVHDLLVRQHARLEKWQRQTDTWASAVGHSTLTLEGERWQRHRRILNPAFRAGTVQRYYSIVIEHTQRLLDQWRDGDTPEMMFEMMRTTMGIIADIIFSVKQLDRDAADLNRALTTVFEVLTARTTALQPVPEWLPTRDNLRMRQASRTIVGFNMRLIRERRADNHNCNDILSDLMQARDDESGHMLTDHEVNNELRTLFGAGHETTALMLMWTLHLLSQYPEIQDRLQAEVDGVLGGHVPTTDDLKSMPYTEQVLHESMRLYPPAWALMVRKAREPISLGDTTIPAGSVILLPQWVVQRDARIFPDPLRFNPDRFDGAWRDRYPAYAYFPFGGGPHVCLGAHLSMFEGRLMLPMMISRFRFEAVPQPAPQLQALLTLRPRHGLRIKINRR